jgi:hypothetical protein
MDLVAGPPPGRAFGNEFGAHATGLRIERRGIKIGNPVEQSPLRMNSLSALRLVSSASEPDWRSFFQVSRNGMAMLLPVGHGAVKAGLGLSGAAAVAVAAPCETARHTGAQGQRPAAAGCRLRHLH